MAKILEFRELSTLYFSSLQHVEDRKGPDRVVLTPKALVTVANLVQT